MDFSHDLEGADGCKRPPWSSLAPFSPIQGIAGEAVLPAKGSGGFLPQWALPSALHP